MTFGQTLKKLREAKGLTQKELSDKLHVSFQTVSKWENDINEPGFSSLKDISKTLNCSIADLFQEENDPNYVLFKKGKLKYKSLDDLLFDTFMGVDKISNETVRTYCHKVVDFVKKEIVKFVIENKIFRSEEDYNANFMNKNYCVSIYGTPFLFTQGNFEKYSVRWMADIYLANQIINKIRSFETDDRKIIKNEPKLAQSIMHPWLESRYLKNINISKFKGLDKENLDLIDEIELFDCFKEVNDEKRECRYIVSEYILGY